MTDDRIDREIAEECDSDGKPDDAIRWEPAPTYCRCAACLKCFLDPLIGDVTGETVERTAICLTRRKQVPELFCHATPPDASHPDPVPDGTKGGGKCPFLTIA
jgi:hypothetical protein